MKVLILQRYGALGASSRLRTGQYLPYLQAAGISYITHSLLDDSYIRNLYAGRRAVGATLRGYWNRLRFLLSAGSYDVVLVEKESLPWIPAFMELALYRNVRLWVDYDDAVFHRYDRHPLAIVRSALGKKLDAVMRRASLVTGGNDYLTDRALQAGSAWVERLPTVVDLARYPRIPPPPRMSEAIVIGWIGSPSTAGYLKLVSEAFTRLSKKYIIDCVAVGARPDQLIDTPFRAVPWSETTEVESIRKMDIGIMPLTDSPWERGKCGYKLIQYMACGLPVVASPVGVNSQIVSDGVNGFLASNSEDWVENVERLIVDASLRKRMGEHGRMRVEREFSLQVQAPRFINFLQRLANANEH